MTNSIHRESSSIRLPWKIVLLGDAGVGKSSLVKRFLTEKYTDMYTPTVEDNYIHNIELPDGLSQCIEILDTSGFYQFPAMKELNIRLATAFILVFDLTLKDTLNDLIELKDIIMNIKGSNNVTIILVGNKVDIINEKHRRLSNTGISEKAQELADDHFKCMYIESSAKNNINVTEIFTKIFDKIFTEQEELQELQNMNRRSSTISFVRRFSSISTVNNIDRARIFSAPNVSQLNSDYVKRETENFKPESGKNPSGILNTLFKNRAEKKCVIS